MYRGHPDFTALITVPSLANKSTSATYLIGTGMVLNQGQRKTVTMDHERMDRRKMKLKFNLSTRHAENGSLSECFSQSHRSTEWNTLSSTSVGTQKRILVHISPRFYIAKQFMRLIVKGMVKRLGSMRVASV